MNPIGKIYQIENGFLLKLASLESFEDLDAPVIYCQDHKELAEVLISKRVAEKLRGYPQQLELDLNTKQDAKK